METACLDEGTLRSAYDESWGDGRRAEIVAHLQSCAACRRRMDEMADRQRWVESRLTALAPAGSNVAPLPNVAWSHLQPRLGKATPARRLPLPRWLDRHAPAFGLGLAVAFLALIFLFAPARTAFGQFLGVFRVHKFAAIRIDPAKVQRLDKLDTSGPEMFGTLEVVKEPAPAREVSLAEARGAVPFPVRTFGWLPDSVQGEDAPLTVRLGDDGEARLTVDAAQVNAALALLGEDDLHVPVALDGATVTVHMPRTVEVEARGAHRFLSLMQMESPSVKVSAPVDPNVLGVVALRVLGFSPDEANRLAAQINWANTLVLPLPTDAVVYQEVEVNGVSGLFIRERSEKGYPPAMLLWQKNDVVYALSGQYAMSDMLAVAEGLH
ncbi:MAG: DUF4367 domain-containing protein [Chloroflexi bacterium]|nr:DUF4367 domain-containing protein [Chloroflexota bacterium]